MAHDGRYLGLEALPSDLIEKLHEAKVQAITSLDLSRWKVCLCKSSPQLELRQAACHASEISPASIYEYADLRHH